MVGKYTSEEVIEKLCTNTSLEYDYIAVYQKVIKQTSFFIVQIKVLGEFIHVSGSSLMRAVNLINSNVVLATQIITGPKYN